MKNEIIFYIEESIEGGFEAKALGYPITDEIVRQLTEHCSKNMVPPRYIYQEFMSLYKDEIAKYQRLKYEGEFQKKQQQNIKKGFIPAGGGTSAGQTPSKTGSVKPASMLDKVMQRVGLGT